MYNFEINWQNKKNEKNYKRAMVVVKKIWKTK